MSAAALLGQVLGITAGGFILTAAVTALLPPLPHGVSFAAMILGFFVVFGVYGTRNNPGLSLGLFYLFTAIEGLAIAPIISRYAALGGSQIVFNAAATTGVGMAVLGLIAFASSFDFRRLTGIAFAALIGVLIVGLISAFTHWIHTPESPEYPSAVKKLQATGKPVAITGAGMNGRCNPVDASSPVRNDVPNSVWHPQ